MKKIVVMLVIISISLKAQVTFTDVTIPAGLDTTNFCSYDGVNWVDYDRDGYYDLYLGKNLLYRNNGNGTFTLVGGNLGLPEGRISSSTWADFDNDGDPDLLILPGWVYQSFPGKNALLYENINADTFIFSTSFPRNPGDLVCASAWADYDRDGYVDFYLANYDSTQFGGKPDRLYHNNGDGTFTDVTGSAIPIDYQCGRGVEWVDYNNDGNPDIYVSNYRLQPNFLYRNSGNGTFTNVAGSVGVAGAYHSYGSAWGDYDNDGDFDLIMPNIHDYPRLYQQQSNGTFVEVTQPAGLYIYGEWSAALWFDYDNDMDLDLFLMQWYQGYYTKLMRNNGNGTFTDVTSTAGVIVPDCCSGIVADFNNDGFLDLVVKYHSPTAWNRHRLYKNNGETGYHWLQIETEGVISNRDGIGARVEIFTGNVRQIREVRAGAEGGSQHMKRVHFGLGNHEVVDSLIVKWPSGIVDKIYNLPCDTILYLVEGSTKINELKANSGIIRKILLSKNLIKLELKGKVNELQQVSLINPDGRICRVKMAKSGCFIYLYPEKAFLPGLYILQMKINGKIFKNKIFVF